MEKTWWWRILLLIITVIVLIVLYVIPCDYRLTRCFWGNNDITRTIFHLFASVLVFLPVVFFINDNIFLKWLWLALGWVVLFVLLIVVFPEQKEGLFSFGGPDKETLSIFLSALFVILSFLKIGWEWKKERD